MRSAIKNIVSLGAALLLVLTLAVTTQADESDPVLDRVLEIDLAAQPLAEALLALSRQSETQIAVASEHVRGRTSPAVRGTMSLGTALSRLLDGTALEAHGRGTNGIAISPARTPLDELLDVGDGATDVDAPLESSAARSVPSRAIDRAAEPADRRVVEEVYVTANRRTQNVQDIVGGISVFQGEDLEKSAAAGFEDYVYRIPGADFVDDGMNKKVAVRGISNMATLTGNINGTTSPIGIYLDDTPIQGNGNLPDLDLYDLQRIEVLKGPQGTLYGEGAQGGAFKLLLNKADPSEFYAKGEVGVGRTVNGSGLNHFQKAAVNTPLLGSWAARLVATRRVDQGYVDFPNRGTRGEDDATNLMGRVHLDGEIWEGFSASAMLLHQRQRRDQFPSAQQEESDLENENFEPQFSNTDFTLGSLTLDYDLGFSTLTSATSMFASDTDALSRAPLVGGVLFSLTNPAAGGDFQEPPRTVEQEWASAVARQLGVVQELRLVSSGDGWIDWVGGAFYRRRTNDALVVVSNSASVEDPPVGPGLFVVDGKETFEHYALFGEATVHLPWSLEFVLGLRGLREQVDLDERVHYGNAFYPIALAAGHPDGWFPNKNLGITTTAFTPKVSLSWVADDWRMLYVTAAEGVRSGGTNIAGVTGDNATPLFLPDTLRSYEVGAKTQWLDGRLTVNVAAFHNDWKDLQLGSAEPDSVGGVPLTLNVILNVARAFTRGVEAEIVALPIEDLTLGFNLFVGEGEIVEGDPEGIIPDHTPMPQLAALSYSAFASYEASRWPIFGFTPSVQFDTQSTGERTANPPLAGVNPILAGFQTYNAQVGFAGERWEASFAVKNLSDERAQLGSNITETRTLTIGRPRTWLFRLGFRY